MYYPPISDNQRYRGGDGQLAHSIAFRPDYSAYSAGGSNGHAQYTHQCCLNFPLISVRAVQRAL